MPQIIVNSINYEPAGTPTQVRVEFGVKTNNGSYFVQDGIIPIADASGESDIRIVAKCYNNAKDQYLLNQAQKDAVNVVGQAFDPTSAAVSDIITSPNSPDVAKPDPVTGISAVENAGNIDVSWDAITLNEEYMRKYQVFRSGPSPTQPPVNTFVAVDEVDHPTATFSEPSPGSTGEVWWYGVRAVDWFDRASNAPTPASITLS